MAANVNQKLTQGSLEYEREITEFKVGFENTLKSNLKLKGIRELFSEGDSFYNYMPEAKKSAIDINVEQFEVEFKALTSLLEQANVLIQQELDKQQNYIDNWDKENSTSQAEGENII